MRSLIFYVYIRVLLIIVNGAQNFNDNDVPQWCGLWNGTLVNYPERHSMSPVIVQMEIGPFPIEDETCSMYRSTYFQNGNVSLVKDYRLCRGIGKENLYIDEGDGVHLDCQWIGQTLQVPFKYDKLILVSSSSVKGDLLQEDILIINDQQTSNGSVVSLKLTMIQRLILHRIRQ